MIICAKPAAGVTKPELEHRAGLAAGFSINHQAQRRGLVTNPLHPEKLGTEKMVEHHPHPQPFSGSQTKGQENGAVTALSALNASSSMPFTAGSVSLCFGPSPMAA